MKFVNSGLEPTYYQIIDIDWEEYDEGVSTELTEQETEIIKGQDLFYRPGRNSGSSFDLKRIGKECGFIPFVLEGEVLLAARKQSESNIFRLHAYQILAGDSTSYESPFFKALTDDYLFNQIVENLGQDLTSKVFNKLTKLLND